MLQLTTFGGTAAGWDKLHAHVFTRLSSITKEHYEKINYGLGIPTGALHPFKTPSQKLIASLEALLVSCVLTEFALQL